jgi:hypothetical protein
VLATNLGDQIFDLVEHCGTATKTYSASAVKLAAAVTATQGALDRRHAFDVYRSLVLLDFDQLPPVAKSLVRQIAQGKVTTAGPKRTFDLLTRAFAVFDRRKAENAKIVVDAQLTKAALKRVRDCIAAGLKPAHDGDAA